MKRSISLVCMVLISCLGQTAPLAKQELTHDQIHAFFNAIEQGRGGVENWEQVQPITREQNIPDQLSLESWSQLINAATKSGLKSRMVLQLHPLLKQRPYFDEFVHVLGYDSDLFTRGQILGNMRRFYPEDPRTAKFGILLLLDAWNEKWPDGVDLHGNSPREMLEIAISNQWEGPRLALNNEGTEGTFGSEVTPERCAQLLAQSDKWEFDKKTQKWRVKSIMEPAK